MINRWEISDYISHNIGHLGTIYTVSRIDPAEYILGRDSIVRKKSLIKSLVWKLWENTVMKGLMVLAVEGPTVTLIQDKLWEKQIVHTLKALVMPMMDATPEELEVLADQVNRRPAEKPQEAPDVPAGPQRPPVFPRVSGGHLDVTTAPKSLPPA